jgi:carboxymethylenebutenolidase
VCFEFDAEPPELPADLARVPIAGGAAAELLELRAADGTAFSAAFAESPQGAEPGVVILPDVRGLYPFYIQLAERFATAGHHAIAIDFYGRTAGLGPRGEDFDYAPHRSQVTPGGVQADLAAAGRELRERTGAIGVATVGFCFGGTHSLLAATGGDVDLDGVVAFYGLLDGERLGYDGPLQLVEKIRLPVLGLYGGADAAIPLEQVHEFDDRLSELGIEHEIEIYDGAPHSFFDKRCDEFAEACEDAWRRVIGFIGHVGAESPV